MDDTIAAIATAYGEGGIGIVRISGEKAKAILSSIFMPKYHSESGNVNRRLVYGHIVDPSNSKVVDEVLSVFMKGPATYTAEDVAEIYCHGSVVSLRKTLELVLASGARLAEKGEFTKRAFLNGRMDLSQAEAVIDVIRAKTEKSYDNALDQMEGKLSEKIGDIRSLILDVLVEIAVNLDYPDEDIEEVTYEKLRNSLSLIYDKLGILIASADTGRMLREGISVAIVGKPNVGKSSLMNVLLQETRAIVTDIPGTTRDTIEEGIDLRGIPVKLIDTAGIRETEDQIEQIGIAKSRQSLEKADLVLFVVDGGQPVSQEDMVILEGVKEKNTVVLVNKADTVFDSVLPAGAASDDGESAEQQIESVGCWLRRRLPEAKLIYTSMVTEQGIDQLLDHIEELVYGGKVSQQESVVVSNVRHRDLLLRAAQSLIDALHMAGEQEAMDFIEVDIRQAYEVLGQITGDSVSEDIIEEVFSRFCLGK